MTDVTIKNEAGTTFTFADGEVKNVESTLNPDIELTAFPGSGPASAFGFDFNGALKQITVEGILFETSASRTDSGSTTTVLEQKQWLEEIINGFQSPMDFTSNYESQSHDGDAFITTQILMGTTRFKEVEADPERLFFTLNLLVGA